MGGDLEFMRLFNVEDVRQLARARAVEYEGHGLTSPKTLMFHVAANSLEALKADVVVSQGAGRGENAGEVLARWVGDAGDERVVLALPSDFARLVVARNWTHLAFDCRVRVSRDVGFHRGRRELRNAPNVAPAEVPTNFHGREKNVPRQVFKANMFEKFASTLWAWAPLISAEPLRCDANRSFCRRSTQAANLDRLILRFSRRAASARTFRSLDSRSRQVRIMALTAVCCT